MTKYHAYYEDRTKAEVYHKLIGDIEFVDAANDPRSAERKVFNTLDEAVAWVVKAVNSELTVFGHGTVLELEPMKTRCRACICRGEQVVRDHTIDDTGLVETLERESDCC